EYEDIGKAFRSRVRAIQSSEPEYARIMGAKRDVEHFIKLLENSTKRKHLHKRDKRTIDLGLARLLEWTNRGFVGQKVAASQHFQQAIDLMERGEYESVLRHLRKVAGSEEVPGRKKIIGQFDLRMDAIIRIVRNEKKRAASLYDEFRKEHPDEDPFPDDGTPMKQGTGEGNSREDQEQQRPAGREFRKILVVDDDAKIRCVLRIFLKAAGFKNITFAGSAEEAKDKLRESVDANSPFDLFLLDGNLPETAADAEEKKGNSTGIHVVLAARELSDLYKNTPAILISAKEQGDIEKAYQEFAGSLAPEDIFDGYIHKPECNPQTLIAAIEKLSARGPEASTTPPSELSSKPLTGQATNDAADTDGTEIAQLTPQDNLKALAAVAMKCLERTDMLVFSDDPDDKKQCRHKLFYFRGRHRRLITMAIFFKLIYGDAKEMTPETLTADEVVKDKVAEISKLSITRDETIFMDLPELDRAICSEAILIVEQAITKEGSELYAAVEVVRDYAQKGTSIFTYLEAETTKDLIDGLRDDTFMRAYSVNAVEAETLLLILTENTIEKIKSAVQVTVERYSLDEKAAAILLAIGNDLRNMKEENTAIFLAEFVKDPIELIRKVRSGIEKNLETAEEQNRRDQLDEDLTDIDYVLRQVEESDPTTPQDETGPITDSEDISSDTGLAMKQGTGEDLERGAREQISDNEIIEFLEDIFFREPSEKKSRLMEIFAPRISYFKNNPGYLTDFAKRFSQFGHRYHDALRKDLLEAKDENYRDVLFLMIVRGTIKDLVWELGANGKGTIEGSGGNSALLYNLFEPEKVKTFLSKVTGNGILKDLQFLKEEIEWSTGHTLEEFQRDPALFEIFADQIVDSIRSALLKRAHSLRKESPQKKEIMVFLSELNSDEYGELGFELTDRSFSYLLGGDRAGDCTDPRAFNFWTVGAWNSTFENFELNTYCKNKFFARFLFMVGRSEGKLVLWVHAIEFTPLVKHKEKTKDSTFVDKNLQKELLIETLKFISSYAKRAGISDVFVTGISNSYGFTDVLTSMLQAIGHQTDVKLTERDFTLLNSIDSAHRLRDVARGRSEKPIPIYLQGWYGSHSFGRRAEEKKEETVDRYLDFAGERIDRGEIDRASRTFMQMVWDRLSREGGIVHKLGYGGFQESLRGAIASENVSKAFDELKSDISASLLRLTELFDPAALETVKKDIGKIERIIDKKKEEESRTTPKISDEIKDFITYLASDICVLQQKLGRLPAENEIIDRIKAEDTYEGIIPGWHDGSMSSGYKIEIDVRGHELENTFDALMASMPRKGFETEDQLEGAIRGWQSDFLKRIRTTQKFGPGSYYKRRPAQLKKIHEKFDKILQQLRALTDIQGAGMMTVMNRLDPELVDAFRKWLQDEGYSAESIRLMTENPADVIDYYITESRSHELEGRTASLTSPVNTFSLEKLMGQFSRYLPFASQAPAPTSDAEGTAMKQGTGEVDEETENILQVIVNSPTIQWQLEQHGEFTLCAYIIGKLEVAAFLGLEPVIEKLDLQLNALVDRGILAKETVVILNIEGKKEKEEEEYKFSLTLKGMEIIAKIPILADSRPDKATQARLLGELDMVSDDEIFQPLSDKDDPDGTETEGTPMKQGTGENNPAETHDAEAETSELRAEGDRGRNVRGSAATSRERPSSTTTHDDNAGAIEGDILKRLEGSGVRLDLINQKINGIDIRVWLKSHGLFHDIPPTTDVYQEKRAQDAASDVYRCSVRKIKETLLAFARGLGQEESMTGNLRDRRTKKALYPLILWMARDSFIAQEREKREGRLFAAIDITNTRLRDMPLWPVNEDGNILWDLIRWMPVKGLAPFPEYYGSEKRSLRQLMPDHFHAEENPFLPGVLDNTAEAADDLFPDTGLAMRQGTGEVEPDDAEALSTVDPEIAEAVRIILTDIEISALAHKVKVKRDGEKVRIVITIRPEHSAEFFGFIVEEENAGFKVIFFQSAIIKDTFSSGVHSRFLDGVRKVLAAAKEEECWIKGIAAEKEAPSKEGESAKRISGRVTKGRVQIEQEEQKTTAAEEASSKEDEEAKRIAEVALKAMQRDGEAMAELMKLLAQTDSPVLWIKLGEELGKLVRGVDRDASGVGISLRSALPLFDHVSGMLSNRRKELEEAVSAPEGEKGDEGIAMKQGTGEADFEGPVYHGSKTQVRILQDTLEVISYSSHLQLRILEQDGFTSTDYLDAYEEVRDELGLKGLVRGKQTAREHLAGPVNHGLLEMEKRKGQNFYSLTAQGRDEVEKLQMKTLDSVELVRGSLPELGDPDEDANVEEFISLSATEISRDLRRYPLQAAPITDSEGISNGAGIAIKQGTGEVLHADQYAQFIADRAERAEIDPEDKELLESIERSDLPPESKEFISFIVKVGPRYLSRRTDAPQDHYVWEVLNRMLERSDIGLVIEKGFELDPGIEDILRGKGKEPGRKKLDIGLAEFDPQNEGSLRTAVNRLRTQKNPKKHIVILTVNAEEVPLDVLAKPKFFEEMDVMLINVKGLPENVQDDENIQRAYQARIIMSMLTAVVTKIETDETKKFCHKQVLRYLVSPYINDPDGFIKNLLGEEESVGFTERFAKMVKYILKGIARPTIDGMGDELHVMREFWTYA
ncbi:MAG: response regulator, partial [Candidatus Omnitrophica bacterium]|nr:response regulator [Candidatus Omnitrophota bacterium]